AAPSIIRISDDGETLIAADTPFVRFDTVSVAFPAGAFLQPSLAGEKALTQLVTAGVGEASTVLDAFCGLGTFALPLSRHGAVTAIDQNGPAMDALDEAARTLTGRRPITTKRRDLMRDPLSPAELNAFDGVVFDPPRAGAKAFAAALAASKVPQVVAVSCEPKTLARDCATLVAGGYKIAHVVPVDQFVATSHLETVVVLRRDP
ncbi:MAG: RsmD family RNA methyltransferase, partial [Pseudomonadota bacterium]